MQVLRPNVRLGYLDVAIVKIRKTRDMQFVIFLRPCFVAVKLANNGRKNIWSVKVGV